MLKGAFLLNSLGLIFLSTTAKIYDDSILDANAFFENFNFTQGTFFPDQPPGSSSLGRNLFIPVETELNTQEIQCVDVGACQGAFSTGTCIFQRALGVYTMQFDENGPAYV